MSDDHNLERRLSRYRPAGPSAEFGRRLLKALDGADGRGVWRFRLPRHAFALATSVLILVCMSLALAGHAGTAGIRDVLTECQRPAATSESEAMPELEFSTEMLAFKRQLDEARAAQRNRGVHALDPAAWGELR